MIIRAKGRDVGTISMRRGAILFKPYNYEDFTVSELKEIAQKISLIIDKGVLK